MRYTYTVVMHGVEERFTNVDKVVDAINAKLGIALLTRDMVYTLFTRPHKMNKRLFDGGTFQITRQKLPKKSRKSK